METHEFSPPIRWLWRNHLEVYLFLHRHTYWLHILSMMRKTNPYISNFSIFFQYVTVADANLGGVPNPSRRDELRLNFMAYLWNFCQIIGLAFPFPLKKYTNWFRHWHVVKLLMKITFIFFQLDNEIGLFLSDRLNLRAYSHRTPAVMEAQMLARTSLI